VQLEVGPAFVLDVRMDELEDNLDGSRAWLSYRRILWVAHRRVLTFLTLHRHFSLYCTKWPKSRKDKDSKIVFTFDVNLWWISGIY
jgi:hypothetical protein